MATRPTDDELREQLKEVDAMDVTVTAWEAEFIESIAFNSAGDLSDKERTKAMEIIETYIGGDDSDDSDDADDF